MASRAELVAYCTELGIDPKDKTSEEMKELIRKTFDKIYDNIPFIGDSLLSEGLGKFLCQEYNYQFRDKDGCLLDLDFNTVIEKKGKRGRPKKEKK